MYVLNTFLRLTRFIANTFIGLVVGFILGVYYATNGAGFFTTMIQNFL